MFKLIFSKKRINIVTLAFIVVIFTTIFCIGIKKGMPPGGDSNIYIMDVYTIVNNNYNFPNDNINSYLGRPLYESPLNSTAILLLYDFTGLKIESSLFIFYQLFLVVLILLLVYIISARLAGPLAGLISSMLLLNFYGLYFLFNSSTIANFLAICYVSFFIFLLVKNKLNYWQYIFLFLIIGLNLYLTHKSLTFVLFLATVFVLKIIDFKSLIKLLKNRRKITLILVSLLALVIIATVIIYFWPTVVNNIKSTSASAPDRFRNKLSFADYIDNINIINIILLIIFFVSCLISKTKYCSKDAIKFMLIWILISIAASLSPYFGIYIYNYRLLYMIWPFLMVLASIGLVFILRNMIKKIKTKIVIISLIIISIVIFSANINYQVFIKTNLVNKNQLQGFEFIRNNSSYGDSVLTNVNDSYPFYVSIATRKIIESEINEKVLEDVQYLRNNNIKYLAVMAGNVNNISLDKYKTFINQHPSLYQLKMENSSMLVYKVNDSVIY